MLSKCLKILIPKWGEFVGGFPEEIRRRLILPTWDG
jgi:hypothetical protein